MSTEVFETFIQFYPSFRDPNIQSILLHKEEFSQVSPKATEDIPPAGKLYSYQEESCRELMASDDGMLLKYRTGVGKSRAVIAYFDRCLNNPMEQVEVYVLVRGKSQVVNILNEIVEYILAKEGRTATSTEEREAMNRKYKKQFHVMTWGSFHKLVRQHGNNVEELSQNRDAIAAQFSSIRLWIDEIQNITVPVDEEGWGINTSESEQALRKKQKRRERQPQKEEKGIPAAKRRQAAANADTYNSILAVLRFGYNNKAVLTSYTPFSVKREGVGYVPEKMASIYNLLRPEDNVPGSFDFLGCTDEEFEEVSRGIFSSITTMDIPIEVIHMGEPVFVDSGLPDYAEVPVYISVMSPFQASLAATVEHREFLQPIATASDMIYPTKMGGTYQLKGKGKEYKTDNRGIYKLDAVKSYRYPHSDEGFFLAGKSGASAFSQRFSLELDSKANDLLRRNPTYYARYQQSEADLATSLNAARLRVLQDYSCKYSAMFYNILFGHYQVEYDDQYPGLGEVSEGAIIGGTTDEPQLWKGNAFIYSERVGGGGVRTIACIARWLGFDPYSESKSAAPFYVAHDGTRSVTISRKPRFVVLTSETEEDLNLPNVLGLQKAAENYNGDYLRLFIGSQVAGFGFSLFNIRQIHLNVALDKQNLIQAESRGLRVNAYTVVTSKMRQAGIMIEPIVYSFLHVAIIVNRDKDGTIVDEDLNMDEGDLHILTLAESRDVPVQRLGDRVNAASVDLYLNCARQERSFLDTVDTKQLHDLNSYPYDPKNRFGLPCPVKKWLPTDKSTYNAYYIDIEAREYVDKIVMALRSRDSVATYELKAEDGSMIDERLLGYLVGEILHSRHWFTDRYGFTCYLSYEEDYFFPVREYGGEYGLLTITEDTNLFARREQPIDRIAIEEFYSICEDPSIDDDTCERTYNNLSPVNKIALVEEWYPITEELDTRTFRIITEHSDNVVYEFPKLRNLEDARRHPLEQRKKTRRAEATQIVKKIDAKDYYDNYWSKAPKEEGRVVYIHSAQMALEVTSGKQPIQTWRRAATDLKIYDDQSGQWVPCNRLEQEVYTDAVQMTIERRLQDEFGMYPYGYLSNGQLYIANASYSDKTVDKYNQYRERNITIEDIFSEKEEHTRRIGRLYHTITPLVKYQVLFYLRHSIDRDGNPTPQSERFPTGLATGGTSGMKKRIAATARILHLKGRGHLAAVQLMPRDFVLFVQDESQKVGSYQWEALLLEALRESGRLVVIM